jgi:hypothetical protein
LTFLKTIAAWRQTKRSPYFFLRQRAERRLQAYMWTLVGLVAMGAATVAFSGQAPIDGTLRMALLANAKPVEAAQAEDGLPVLSFDQEENSGPQSVDFSLLAPMVERTAELTQTSTVSSGRPLTSLPEGLTLTPQLPEEFDQFDPEVELIDDTAMSPLVFSTEIDDEYKAVGATSTFGEGFFTIYATFDYTAMADGMEWAWVWRHNGEIVNGGNELWAYGDEGPGWIYYEPPEGFQPGDYSLEVWVNGELFQRASLSIEREVANR